MNFIAELRGKIDREVFDYQVLVHALSGYRKPRDRITRLIAGGVIVRIKKGLYCFGETLRREPIPREYLANLIYGPSYVSLDSALSRHGLIPERVAAVTSVTTRRSRGFDTPFGRFFYRTLSTQRYATGAVLATETNTAFLIASPEKALVDKVWTDKRFNGTRISDYEKYLLDDLRIDKDVLERIDWPGLQKIATAFYSAKIDNLVRYLNRIREPSHA